MYFQTPTLVIHCSTCSNDINSCICLSCFFQRNHSNHIIIPEITEYGNCDFGDSRSISKDGFCSHNSKYDIETSLKSLDSILIDNIREISKIIFSSFNETTY
jgi:hypothetical protein